jgi:hypothetical protein
LRRIAWAIAVLVVAGAAFAGEPVWFVDAAGDPPAAKWGIPGTDAVGFVVACGEDGGAVVSPALYAMERPAEAPDVLFVIDGDRYVRDARLVFSERDGAFRAEIVVPRTGALIEGMRRGYDLTYDFEPVLREGDRFTLSLSGSADAIDEALGAC